MFVRFRDKRHSVNFIITTRIPLAKDADYERLQDSPKHNTIYGTRISSKAREDDMALETLFFSICDDTLAHRMPGETIIPVFVLDYSGMRYHTNIRKDVQVFQEKNTLDGKTIWPKFTRHVITFEETKSGVNWSRYLKDRPFIQRAAQGTKDSE